MQLVLKAGAALRAVPRIFEIMHAPLGPQSITPSASAVRSWVQRLGLFALQEVLPVADDWLLMIDHTIQVGTVKAGVIVGIRQSELPSPSRPLKHTDLHLIGLHPVETSTGEIVAEQLEQAARRVGIPRQICSDHGSDVKKGSEIFAARHPETRLVYDIAHQGAIALKSRLEAHPQWSEFNTRLGQVKAKLLQTSDAYLVSPSPRPKARYMNVGPVLRWCGKVFRLMDQDPQQNPASERARHRYEWMEDYRESINEWTRWESTIRSAVSFVRTNGLRAAGEWSLLAVLCARPENERHLELETELFNTMRESCSALRADEVLLGSTEVLESLFGKWKTFERQESKSGMTSQILSLGMIVGEWPTERISEGLLTTAVKHVTNWLAEHLPLSLQTQRREAFEEPKP